MPRKRTPATRCSRIKLATIVSRDVNRCDKADARLRFPAPGSGLRPRYLRQLLAEALALSEVPQLKLLGRLEYFLRLCDVLPVSTQLGEDAALPSQRLVAFRHVLFRQCQKLTDHFDTVQRHRRL